MSATAVALAVCDCSFSVIQPVSTARVFPLGCIPDADFMSFIARRSGGVMWVANLAALGAVLITPDVFGSLDKLASRSHSLPEIQIILDSVSQRCSFFPQGRILEPPHPRLPPLSLETVNPSLGVAGGAVAGHTNQPRLLHKDALNTNMQVCCYSLSTSIISNILFHYIHCWFSFGYLLKPALDLCPVCSGVSSLAEAGAIEKISTFMIITVCF